MLTGRRAFDGEDVDRRCGGPARRARLEGAAARRAGERPHAAARLPPKRSQGALGDIAVVRYLLDRDVGPSGREAVGRAQRARRRAPRSLAAVAVAVLALAAFGLLLWQPWVQPAAPAPPVRLTVDIGAESSLVDAFGASAILSPDGTMLAFTATGNVNTVSVSLYVRRLDQLQATQLAGTEGALNPFFSPDGKSIGFFAAGKLKKIAVAGGPAVTLCDAPSRARRQLE